MVSAPGRRSRLAPERQDFSPAARPAGARGRLLRDRAGAVYAVVLPRGAALLAGRFGLALGSGGAAEIGGGFGDLAGSLPARRRTAREAARRAGAALGDKEDTRVLLSKLAAGVARRLDARCRRSGRQPGGVRVSGRLPRGERVSSVAFRLVAGKRHACALWQPHGSVCNGRDHAYQGGVAGSGKGHALLGRPQLSRLPALAASQRNGGPDAVEGQETFAFGSGRALRRRLLPRCAVRLGKGPAPRALADRGARHRICSGRHRTRSSIAW